MKRLFTVIASSLFAAGVSAHDVYGELGKGNSDVSDQHPPQNQMTALQPSIGDRFDRYQGVADGNSDLFTSDHNGLTDAGDSPNIYKGVSGNPDLSF